MINSEEEILQRVREFISENLLYMRPDYQLEEDESLFEAGIIDSMGVMELITFLEEEFDLTVDDEEITEENLGSLRGITRYVARSVSSRKVAEVEV